MDMLLSSWPLTKPSVQLSDEGNYKCRVLVKGARFEKPVQLNVIGNHDKSLQINSTIYYACKVAISMILVVTQIYSKVFSLSLNFSPQLRNPNSIIGFQGQF